MCGIAGIVAGAGGVTLPLVEHMRDTLTHRGPDDAGAWVSPDVTVGLGHRRLSVLDLSERGRQPMASADGRVQLAYNGEVYNFAELRRELEAAGARFRTETDTEVILQAYLAWGIDCVERLQGMFAFALWDDRDRTLWLVRDRFGIKPLVYAHVGEQLAFGSEIAAVLASGLEAGEYSAAAVWDFFSYGYVPTPSTIYTNIRKLPPATVLRFRDGEVELRTWWQPRFGGVEDDGETAARRLGDLIDRAVDDALVADVPTGVFLSGGLDSSIVTRRAAEVFRAAAAADSPAQGTRRLGGGRLQSFSIGFDIEEHSELAYARAAASAYGTEHTEGIVTREMSRALADDMLEMFPEPFAASSALPMAHLARLARERVTVALSGEGGDEAFGGYSWYRWWQRFQRPGFWRTRAGQLARRALEALIRRPKKKWRLPALGPVELYAQLMGAVTSGDKAGILSPEVTRAVAGRDSAEHVRRWWREDLPPMARLQYVDLMTFLPDLNLARADMTSMRASLELRVPLLDHRVVEYALGLAPEVRNPGGELKGLFKRAMQERLPEPIRTRPKKGFSAPVQQWFTGGDLVELVRAVCAERPEATRTWLHPEIERYAARVKGSRAFKLWMFLGWLRRHAG